MAPRKKGKSPEEIEADRVSRESRSIRAAPGAEPTWVNPREPLAPAVREALSGSAKRSIIDDALAAFPDVKEAVTSQSLLAAVVIAQALDRLGRRMIEAAAVSRPIGE